MNDLISRGALLEIFNHDLACFETGGKTEKEMYISVADMRKMIKAQPTVCIENNSWIPISERIPNEEEMKQAYCRNHYGSEFIVMIAGANKPTTLYRTMDGFWVDDERIPYKVSAWLPLPKPYTGENNE